MDNNNRKDRQAGVLGTLLLHALLFLILWLGFIRSEVPQEESGVPVMLGTELLAQGEGGKLEMTEVDILPDAEEIPASPEKNISQTGEEILSQDIEETVTIDPKKEESQKEEVAEQKTPDPQTEPREKTEAELREEAERAAAEAAAKSIAGAFGKGASMKDRGDANTGTGVQGSPTGNGDTGKSTGTGGYGSWDLGGRSLEGKLPRPVYNVQDEGRVVVTITVTPTGQVIRAEIHKRTNTVNSALRKAALEAARKARFNAVDGLNNQSGTITYFFKLK